MKIKNFVAAAAISSALILGGCATSDYDTTADVPAIETGIEQENDLAMRSPQEDLNNTTFPGEAENDELQAYPNQDNTNVWTREGETDETGAMVDTDLENNQTASEDVPTMTNDTTAAMDEQENETARIQANNQNNQTTQSAQVDNQTPTSDVLTTNENADNEQQVADLQNELVQALEQRVEQLRGQQQLTASEEQWLESVQSRIDLMAQMSEQLTNELDEMQSTLAQNQDEDMEAATR